MFPRFCLLAAFALTLSACDTIPERYAFWNDDATSRDATEAPPNLADVPAPADTDAAKAEMEAMQNRLAAERHQAYLASQGFVPMEDQTQPQFDPAFEAPAAPADLPPPVQYQYPAGSGTVQYNYAPSNDTAYVYGYSPVQIARSGQISAYEQQAQAIVAANDSISIDFSALDSGAAAPMSAHDAMSSAVLSGLPLVYFKHGSSSLDAKDRQTLKQLAEELKAQPVSVVIAGHASKRTGLGNPVLSRDVNLRMSAKRANAVMKELAKYGVSPEQIFVTAYGDSMPNIGKDGGLSQEAADRRVEILLDK